MIVLISEALLLRASATDGRILWDRVLCGFGVRLNAEPWSLGQVQRVVTAALESTGPGKLKGEPSLPDQRTSRIHNENLSGHLAARQKERSAGDGTRSDISDNGGGINIGDSGFTQNRERAGRSEVDRCLAASHPGTRHSGGDGRCGVCRFASAASGKEGHHQRSQEYGSDAGNSMELVHAIFPCKWIKKKIFNMIGRPTVGSKTKVLRDRFRVVHRLGECWPTQPRSCVRWLA